MKVSGKAKWWIAIALVIGAYSCLLYWMQRCPPVYGLVVDQDTGEPLAGVEVYKTAVGPTVLAFEAHVYFEGANSITKTDPQGHFRFPAGLASNGPLCILPLQWINGARLTVYSKDYITYQKQDDPWSGRSWAVHKAQARGYKYRVELKKATNEKQWEEKCGAILDGANFLPQELGDKWKFYDLMGYLQRWPGGQRSGHYYRLLWETANLVPCNPYQRQDFRTGHLSRTRLETYCERASRIILLAESFPKPPIGMSEESFRNGLEEARKQLSCGREILGIGISDAGGRRP